MSDEELDPEENAETEENAENAETEAPATDDKVAEYDEKVMEAVEFCPEGCVGICSMRSSGHATCPNGYTPFLTQAQKDDVEAAASDED